MVDMWKAITRMEKDAEPVGAVDLCALADQLEEKGGKYNLRLAAGLRKMAERGVYPEWALEVNYNKAIWIWYACPHTEACVTPAQYGRMLKLSRPLSWYTFQDSPGGVVGTGEWPAICYHTLRQALTAWALTYEE